MPPEDPPDPVVETPVRGDAAPVGSRRRAPDGCFDAAVAMLIVVVNTILCAPIVLGSQGSGRKLFGSLLWLIATGHAATAVLMIVRLRFQLREGAPPRGLGVIVGCAIAAILDSMCASG